MRHATEQDLDQLERFLSELRESADAASFARGSKAFLHSHADDGDLYVDVRLGKGRFDRVLVTSPEEQADLVARIRDALPQPRLSD